MSEWPCTTTAIVVRLVVVCQGHGVKGGATVLKVGRGTILRAERAKKFFDPPHFLASGGGQNIV